MSIQSEINRIAGAKSDIADAIEGKDVTVPSGTKLDGMANLIRQISGGSEKLNSTQAADAYDPTATYAVGDKRSYAGNVYSCISPISTPEAWDSTHWVQVDPIQDQVDDVRNTLNTEIATRQTYVRPNLLDNWYFVYGKAINNDYSSNGTFPVNQRGQQSYTSSGYTIDRWKQANGSGDVSIATNGTGLTIKTRTGTSSNGYFTQVLENVDLDNVIFTLSVMANGILYSTVSTDSTAITLPSGTLLYKSSNNAITIRTSATGDTIQAIKLELGSGQTLAHQENGVWVLNEIPDYSEQLYRCCTSTADSSDTYANRTVCYSRNLQNIITLTENQYVSPFTHYGTWNVYPLLKPGEKVISASAIDSTDGIPMVCGLNSERNSISVIGTKTSAIVLATIAKT